MTANAGIMKKLTGLTKYGEAWLAALLFIILSLIIVPMPTHLVDLLIALDLMLSVVIVLTSMYVTRVLDFTVFPSMLLVTTLLRISISIATARLILSKTANNYKGGPNGTLHDMNAALESAGSVIHAFGQFVAGGNAVIGLIMFVIITVVQFVIVAQGAGRVAEVAARFTLDSLPGKQMVIDAEFNNRIITPEQAQQKRADLQSEMDFYGSMDGAMKFVKGDAIAGIIIIIVNIVGGFIVGGVMGHMKFGDAAKTFTVLTVGDGLVAQIPALLVAISAGLVVTRSTSNNNMGTELGAQLVQSPRALGIAAIIIGALGLVPGLPKLPLLSLAFVVGATSWFLTRKHKRATALEEDIAGAEAPSDEINPQLLKIDAIALEVGADLAVLANPEAATKGELLERLKQVRKRVAMEFGVIAPGTRVRPHTGLAPGAYQIRIKGDLVAQGEVMLDHMLGIGPNLDVPGLDAELTEDPIYNTPALWVPRAQVSVAESAGLQLFDPQDVVATHVAEVIKQHLDELLTREEVNELLNMARQDAPTAVAELIPNMLTLGQVRMVLQNLVREQVPVKDMPTILNALADQAMSTKDVFQLTEFVRQALGRKICQRYQSPDGVIRAFTLSPQVEQTIQSAIGVDASGQVLNLDPHTSQVLHNNLAMALQRHRHEILDPVIICSPKLRRFIKKLFERAFAKIVVLSYAEVVRGVGIQALEEVGLEEQRNVA